MTETIQFKKQRELGSLLSDLFKFIRLEWKSFFTLILKITGPALLVLLIAYIFYMQTFLGSFSLLESIGTFESLGITFFIALLVMMAAGVLYYGLLYGTVVFYVKSYIKNDGVVNKQEVTAGVRNKFWSLLGLGFLVGMITVVGFVFCLIPGIYLGVVLATAFSVLIFEERNIMETISYCFDLIKNEWFMTFATFLVVFLLYYFINVIFQIPQYIYFFVKAFASSETVSADPSTMFDWVYTALTSISMLFQYLLYSIIVLSTVFVYFNLNEKKNFTGTMETIDSLGEGN